jgi:nickel-type superoxide dismutase maturation protease
MPETGASASGLWRRLRSRRLVVVDRSMTPALWPGDRILVDPAPLREALPPVGAIVALADPEVPGRLLLKRVVALDETSGTVSVLGDARDASRDSRVFGPVPRGSLRGIAWYRYLPRSRRGPLSAEVVASVPKP